MLPRVSRTFALNIRLLAGPLRQAVGVGYLLCRAADTIEDAWPGTAAEIEARFDLLLEAVAGDGAAAEALAARAAARSLLPGTAATTSSWSPASRAPGAPGAPCPTRTAKRSPAACAPWPPGCAATRRAPPRARPARPTSTPRPSCTTTAGWSPAASA